MADPNDSRHNYIKKLSKLDLSDLTAGALHHITIAHDDWCGIYDDKLCNCDPYIYPPKDWPVGTH